MLAPPFNPSTFITKQCVIIAALFPLSHIKINCHGHMNLSTQHDPISQPLIQWYIKQREMELAEGSARASWFGAELQIGQSHILFHFSVAFSKAQDI